MRRLDEVVVEGETLSARLLSSDASSHSRSQIGLQRVIPSSTDLSEVDFRGKNLDSVDFSDICLRGACLANTSLRGTNFRGADLFRADLSGAELGGARFICADLRDADLRSVTFDAGKALFADARLDGANLEGAVGAGENLACDMQLKGVQSIADSYGKLFVALQAALAFCAITILTTTDDKLVPNSLLSELPVLKTQVPIALFFHIAPVIVLGFFIYTEMVHREFLRALHRLPAILSDGRRPESAFAPWILRERARPTGRWQRRPKTRERRLSEPALSLYASWSAPFVILLFWFRYLPVHSLASSEFQLGVALASAIVACSFGGESAGIVKRILSVRKAEWIYSGFAMLFAFSYIAGTGRVSPTFNATFSHRELSSSAPPGESSDMAPATRRLDLRDRNLRYANAESSLLANAEFDGSDLTGVNFQHALLRGATFENPAENTTEKATIYHTDFSWADFSNGPNLKFTIKDSAEIGNESQTRFSGAKFDRSFMANLNLSGVRAAQATFRGAHLENSHFIRTVLDHAQFDDAHLDRAEFLGANLVSASFLKAIATSADFSPAVTDPKSPTVLRLANFSAAHLADAIFAGAILESTNFGGADLTNADFTGSTLSGTNMCSATLKGTVFAHSDLSGALGLQQTQLQAAKLEEIGKFPSGAKDLASVAPEYWEEQKKLCPADK